MKIVRNFAGINAICFSLILSSCGGQSGNENSCGDSTKPIRYAVIQYDATLVRYSQPIESQSALSASTTIVDSQPVAWNAFSIEIAAKWQYYSGFRLPRLSLFEQAMACSPVEHATQKLAAISITSAQDYSDKYPAGSELAPLFGAIDLLGTVTGLHGAEAPKELKLKLLGAPQYASQNFEIKITLDDGNIYIMQTGDVYFKLP